MGQMPGLRGAKQDHFFGGAELGDILSGGGGGGAFKPVIPLAWGTNGGAVLGGQTAKSRSPRRGGGLGGRATHDYVASGGDQLELFLSGGGGGGGSRTAHLARSASGGSGGGYPGRTASPATAALAAAAALAMKEHEAEAAARAAAAAANGGGGRGNTGVAGDAMGNEASDPSLLALDPLSLLFPAMGGVDQALVGSGGATHSHPHAPRPQPHPAIARKASMSSLAQLQGAAAVGNVPPALSRLSGPGPSPLSTMGGPSAASAAAARAPPEASAASAAAAPSVDAASAPSRPLANGGGGSHSSASQQHHSQLLASLGIDGRETPFTAALVR